ncbi:tectonic-1 isoform X8 [Syngnathus typhle]|uniref:tectonic-1 isoform X8 n=1 Tax=Syngnathus typhle TaxID=161592 RepID=UPI002A69B2D0|nr:tectonic-1 isoform X8 [Syngnathus typhle]
MEVAVAMIWFAFCCVYMVLFSAVVASKENFTGYDVNLTAITNRNLSHDESLDNSAFALPQTTDVDSFTSNSSYKATEVPNRQLFNIEVLQPVSGHLLTPTIDVGNVCSCDELEDLCDINCCCDKECSQELALFTGCTMLTLSGNNQFCSHATASYALQYTVEGYSQLQSFVQQEMYHDSFCIQSHNRLAGFHFPAPTLPLARNFDSLFTQFNKFAFSSLENNDMSTNILAELQKFYQYGDAIMSAKENGKSGFLYLPSSSISVDCVDQSPVAFLVDRQSRCSRRVDLKEDCSSRPSISIDTYTNINLYAGRNGGATVVPVEMASLVLQSLDGTQNEVIINEEENMQPSLINQKVCINVVLKVAYFVKYNKAGQIVNTTVHLLLGNFHITPFSLEQEFSVKFIQEIKNAPFQNSGNPGHIVGLPILSGQEIAEGMVLNVNPEDTLSLLQSSANHDCMNSVHNRSPVLFGVDSISGCTLRLEDVANCSLVSHIILDVLRGQTSRQYVATFGNSELQNPLDWVPIKHNYNDRDSQICSIPLSLHLQIEWTKYGFLWNPQTQIVSVEEIIQTNATILASFIRGSDALSIQSLVSFKEISAAALSGYRATPTINAKLPIDFFFPFV